MTASRFAPDEAQMHQAVLHANERAERLALRIVAARRALKRGDYASALAILDNDQENAHVDR